MPWKRMLTYLIQFGWIVGDALFSLAVTEDHADRLRTAQQERWRAKLAQLEAIPEAQRRRWQSWFLRIRKAEGRYMGFVV